MIQTGGTMLDLFIQVSTLVRKSGGWICFGTVVCLDKSSMWGWCDYPRDRPIVREEIANLQHVLSLYSGRGICSALTNAFEPQRATVKLQTEATGFKWGWTKSKYEGVVWWTAEVMKAWPPLKARALTGPLHNTAFSEVIAWHLSYMAWCYRSMKQVSWWLTCQPSLGLPRPFLGKVNAEFGCMCQVAEAAAVSPLPASLPSYGAAALLHCDTAWLQKCRARISLFK